MPDQRSPSSWGRGRTIFASRLDTIRREISEGLLLTTIYDRHKAALGIRYPGFCKLVARYAADAKPLRRRQALALAAGPAPSRPPSPAPAPPPSPAYPTPEVQTHARHEPAGRPDFKHHGIVQEGEPEQLFGPDFLPKRGS